MSGSSARRPHQFRYQLIDRNLCRIDERADFAFSAEMIEIRRQAVADVDHRRRQLLFTKQQTPADAWLGLKLTQ